MFLTLTLPSYGAVQDGAPADPASYNYRRAALDAILFPRLVDQFWKTLRRAAGYEVQYFSAVEPQRRLAPHLHAAIRGAIPRKVLRQVAAATYLQVWWPAFDQAVYTDRAAALDGQPTTPTRQPVSCCPPGIKPSTPSTTTPTLGRRM